MVRTESENRITLLPVSGFFFLAILLSVSLADYMTRAWR